MIERFNFYDIYAYLIPGFVLVALLWLPFGIAADAWPQADFASAVAALLLGYVVGHVLHTVAGRSIRVSRRGRFPSDMALAGETKTLSPEVVRGVKRALRVRYGLDLGAAESGVTDEDEAAKKRLRDAPRLCREDVLREKVGTYAEQFQGMYALLRGLLAASLLGASFYLGWLLTHLVPDLRSSLAGLVDVGWMALLIALVLSGALIVLALKKSALLLWSLVLLVGFLGLASGSRLPLDSDRSFILLVAVVGLALVGATSWVAFRRFTLLWADEIFCGFYALALEKGWTTRAEEPTEPGRPPEPESSSE